MSPPQPPGSLSWGLGVAVSSGCPPELLGEGVWHRGAACIGIYGIYWRCGNAAGCWELRAEQTAGGAERGDAQLQGGRCGEALRRSTGLLAGDVVLGCLSRGSWLVPSEALMFMVVWHRLGNSWQTATGSQRWRKPGGGRFWKVPYPPCPMESSGGCWQTPGPGTPSPPGSPAIWRSTSSSFPLLYLLAHEAKRAVAKQTKLKPSGLIATSD